MDKNLFVAFPQDFELRGELIDLARADEIPTALACLGNTPIIKDLASVYSRTRKYVIIEHDDFVVHLLLSGWHVYELPKPSNSKESMAVYYARSANMNHGLLIYVLPPDSLTSVHFHKISTETYYLIAGKAEVHLGGSNVVDLNASDRSVVTIGRGITHPVKTSNSPAVILIHLQDCPHGLSMEDHYYPDGTHGAPNQWDK
jgi:mannose-6-phosphate isomerase-like protein (cupin superfamily)